MVLAFCLAWAGWGIACGGADNWQIAMQNVSSIQCYLWDLTLLHAQRHDFAQLSMMFKSLQVRALCAHMHAI